MRPALLAALLASCLAAAQPADAPTAPPVFAVPEVEPPQAQPVPLEPEAPADQAPPVAQPAPAPQQDPYVPPTYWQRCFAVPAQVWVPSPGGRYYLYGSAPLTTSGPTTGSPNFHGAKPVGAETPAKGGSSSGGSSGGSGGGMDGKALLVLAVVVVAALPIVIYVIDSDAPQAVEQRFHCPSFGLEAYGGVDLSAVVGGVAGTGTGRLSFGYSYFGTDFEFTYAGNSITAWGGHLLLRIAPKNHIEPNIAFGYRALALGGAVRQGFELGVPHRYVFWRDNLRQFALELRPTFTFGLGTFDVGLEAALVVPIVEPVHLRAGGKVQSFGEDVIGGVNLGLSFQL